jgi:origin recognition complex subunit 4
MQNNSQHGMIKASILSVVRTETGRASTTGRLIGPSLCCMQPFRMTQFDPSPRSSKRRKLATIGADSAKAKASSSPYRGVAKAVSSISRRLLKPADSEDELAQRHLSPNVQDSAYASKEASSIGEDTTRPVSSQEVEQSAEASESADELAYPEITVTPTKSQRSGVRPKQKSTKSARERVIASSDVERSENTLAQTRSSSRERKRPKRFPTNWEDKSKPALPRDIPTPNRKGNRASRKTAVFDQETEEDFGFRDPDKSASKSFERPVPGGKLFASYKAQDEVDENVHQMPQEWMNGENREAALLEEQPIPDVPELPVLDATTLLDSSPVAADSRLDAAKFLVLSRLSGQSFTPLTNLEVEYSKLQSLLSATVKAGEGNSILLLGSRGVGKTCLVETVIANLGTECTEDFHVIRLNGLLQTDDKLALREIWRQLGREMRVEEDETAQVITYADTMSSLLYLLSHPEELAETLGPDALSRTTKSVVFVLDEFDLFTIHPRQTLLYNLFDIAQARKAPIAVIGCTARVDVSENLEKRVKSRFSHRWIHLPLAKSFSAFEEIARAALLLRETETTHIGQGISRKLRIDWNAFIEVCRIFLRVMV